MAPEIFETNQYGYGVDIWSLGVLLYELFHGYSPFKGKSAFVIYKNIQERKVKFNPAIPLDVKKLISKILKINPSDRLTLQQIKQHDFLKVLSAMKREDESLPIKNLKFILEHNKSLNSFGRIVNKNSNTNSIYTKCNYSNLDTFPSTPNKNL